MPDNVLVGFDSEESGRRTVKAVAAFEREHRSQYKGDQANNRAFIRVVAPSIYTGSLGPAWLGVKGEIIKRMNDTVGYEATFQFVNLIYEAFRAEPAVGDIVEADLVWTDDAGVAVYVLVPSSEGFIADHVHVVADGGSGAITCRRVTLSDPAAWPPVEASPVVEYENVYESEDREARIVDTPGTATHIIPLYKDRYGNFYINFWKTCAFDDIELLEDVEITSIVQNSDCTFSVTLSKTFGTKRWFVDVNPPGNRESGLRLRIGTQAALPDVCGTGVGEPTGLLLSLTKSL